MDPCVICLEPLVTSHSVTHTLRCGHVFHRSCIDNALAVTAATCPLCRRVVPGVAPPRPVPRGRTVPGVNRHQLMQRLDRIDRLISMVSRRLQQIPDHQLTGANLARTTREIRDVRLLLHQRPAAQGRVVSTSASTRDSQAVLPDRPRRVRPPQSQILSRQSDVDATSMGRRIALESHNHRQARPSTSADSCV